MENILKHVLDASDVSPMPNKEPMKIDTTPLPPLHPMNGTFSAPIFLPNKEPTKEWSDKDSWCVSVIAEAMTFARTNPIGTDASHMTVALREKVREEINAALKFREAELIEKVTDRKSKPSYGAYTTKDAQVFWEGKDCAFDEVIALIKG